MVVLSEVAPTPNIDRIAENGMRFDRCLVTNSICGPSRATILTGKYGHLNGFFLNEENDFDGSASKLFPNFFRQRAIKRRLIGKVAPGIRTHRFRPLGCTAKAGLLL
jgi:arylsulfatase A-like enzyme